MRHRLICAAAIAGALLPGTAATATAADRQPRATRAALPAAEQPRIDGRWRITVTPRPGSGLSAQRLVWRMRPVCDAGACAVVVSGGGEPFRMVPDARFVYRDAPPEQRVAVDCPVVGRDGRERTIRRGATASASHRFTVTRSTAADDATGARATRVDGISTIAYVPTRAGRAGGCVGYTIVYRLRGARV